MERWVAVSQTDIGRRDIPKEDPQIDIVTHVAGEAFRYQDRGDALGWLRPRRQELESLARGLEARFAVELRVAHLPLRQGRYLLKEGDVLLPRSEGIQYGP